MSSADNNSNSASSSKPLPPAATPTHGNLLAAAPQRGLNYFPQEEERESGSRSFSGQTEAHHMWASGTVKKSIFIYFYFLFL